MSVFWLFLPTAVPFLVVFLAVHPSTYRTAGLRWGTATSSSTSPGTSSGSVRLAEYRAGVGTTPRSVCCGRRRDVYDLHRSHLVEQLGPVTEAGSAAAPR